MLAFAMRPRLLFARGAHLAARLAAVCVLIAAAWLPSAHAERIHRYEVSVDPGLTQISVRACFEGKPPIRLTAESLDAASVLLSAQVEASRKRLEPNGAELNLGNLPDGTCISYVSDIANVQRRHDRTRGPARRIGPDLITDVGLWLWRPGSLAEDEDIEVRFALPDGVSASAPWKPVRDSAGTIIAYRTGRGPYDWPAAVAFGTFTERELEVGGAKLRISVLHGSPAVEWELVREWLTRAAQAVTTLYGRFPVDTAQILVVPGARGDEPVPWAFVLRGGMASVHFFINQRRTLDEFLADWTAVHELSHLLLPYVRPEDAWLSEGTASYYQNVLRARSGVITAADAWQRLHSGFRRGMKSMPGITLADATERMYRDGAFMRVYWHGAATLLLADQRLRARTQGRESLDTALAKLQQCCLAPDQGWQASTLFAKLDALTGTSVFGELLAEQNASRFPDLSEPYALLGLRLTDGGGTIEMIDEGAQVGDREAIMRRR
jgi:hypothetical protein